VGEQMAEGWERRWLLSAARERVHATPSLEPGSLLGGVCSGIFGFWFTYA